MTLTLHCNVNTNSRLVGVLLIGIHGFTFVTPGTLVIPDAFFGPVNFVSAFVPGSSEYPRYLVELTN
jgi:hypothetical protein